MLTNLLKAAVSVAATPVALVGDVLSIPETSYSDRHPFRYTRALLNNAREAFNEAVRPVPEKCNGE